MEKYFVTYKQAVALKEIGYDKYSWFGMECSLYKADGNHTFYANGIGDETYISAPLKSQVFKWFRDEHNIVHTVYSNASGYIWELHYNKERGGTHICDSEESGDCELSGMFTTYEEAESACIDKLIEIIKKK